MHGTRTRANGPGKSSHCVGEAGMEGTGGKLNNPMGAELAAKKKKKDALNVEL